MLSKNPKDAKSITSDKSWHASTEEDRLGFISRNSTIANSIATPQAIWPLGRAMSPACVAVQGTDTGWERQIVWDTVGGPASPGIMTLEFDPVFARMYNARTTIDEMPITDLYKTLWVAMRKKQRLTENFEAGDLQFATMALANFEMHIGNIKRLLRVFDTAHVSPNSRYYSPENLAYALGFRISEDDMKNNITQWRNFFNGSILGIWNEITWLQDVIPGFYRWRALCTEVYKDTSADTDYCQLYVLRPRTVYSAGRRLDADNVYQWALAENPDATDPTSASLMFLSSDAATPANYDGVKCVWNYLTWVRTQMRNFFYDSDIQDIMSCMNALSEYEIVGRKIEKFREPWLDVDMEPIPLTWDFKMMLAIHNASITPLDTTAGNTAYYMVAGASEPLFTGTMVGHVLYDSSSNGRRILQAAKIINLPCFGATNADYANATQWTICDDITAINEWKVQPFAAGTEFISHASVLIYNVDGGAAAPVGFPYQQVVYANDERAAAYVAEDATGAIYKTITCAPSFLFAPILYYVKTRETPNGVKAYVDTIGCEDEVLYTISAYDLGRIHEVWTQNFHGLPIDVPAPESPKFETDVAGKSNHISRAATG